MSQARVHPHRPSDGKHGSDGEAAVWVGMGEEEWLGDFFYDSEQQVTRVSLGHQGCVHQALAFQIYKKSLHLRKARITWHLPWWTT